MISTLLTSYPPRWIRATAQHGAALPDLQGARQGGVKQDQSSAKYDHPHSWSGRLTEAQQIVPQPRSRSNKEAKRQDDHWGSSVVARTDAGLETEWLRVEATRMSTSNAAKVRLGKRVPHPRWWEALRALSENQWVRQVATESRIADSGHETLHVWRANAVDSDDCS